MAPRAKTLPILKHISNSDFDEICATFKIPRNNRKILRQMIDGAIAAVAEIRDTGKVSATAPPVRPKPYQERY